MCVFVIVWQTFVVNITEGIPMTEDNATAFKVTHAFFQNRIVHIQIDNGTDFLKMFHGIFAENSTAARCDNTFGNIDFAVNLIFNIDEFFDTLFFNDLPQKLAFFFLNNQVRVNKLVTQYLCQNHANGTFSGTWHTD